MSPREAPRVGRTEFGHRLLFFLDFLTLDGQRQLSRLTINGGDLGIDLFTYGEAVRALIAFVPRKLGTADEPGQHVVDLDLDAVGLNRAHDAGYDIALVDGVEDGCRRIIAHLLDAEADAFLLDIDVEHLCLDGLALLVAGHRGLARLRPMTSRTCESCRRYPGTGR